MKIAIAAKHENVNSEVDNISARAPFYLIFENKKLIKTIKNPFQFGSGGAGYSVAQMLSNENVELTVAGSFGQNMVGALEEKNIKYKVVNNKTVKEVLEEI
ncbi:hypothetical protein KO465_01515 [Candidatus Micrarchaeota archaeon]|jgi:predicted Fe-Mo cluster-binding NifX family protein|nr:hypothetical protein [Candidatus Micrarchaeota archaeon]